MSAIGEPDVPSSFTCMVKGHLVCPSGVGGVVAGVCFGPAQHPHASWGSEYPQIVEDMTETTVGCVG